MIHKTLILLVGIAVYSNTFHGPFQYDELKYLVTNPVVKDLSLPLENIQDDLELTKFVKQRPVGMFSFALNYRLHGAAVEGYHIVNLLIHLANAMLVYWLVLLAFSAPVLRRSYLRGRAGVIALFTALLFVSHPIQTQAVTYVHQRFASLVTLFSLLAVACYAKWRHEDVPDPADGGDGHAAGRGLPVKAWFWFTAALLSTILAMKTKENAVTLPVMLTVYEFFFHAGPAKRRMLRLAPFLLTLAVIPYTTYTLMTENRVRIDQITAASGVISGREYLLTEFRVMMTYLRLLVLPVGQNADHDYPVFTSLFHPEVAASLVALLVIAGAVVFLVYRSVKSDPALRLIAFGIIWFFVTISVESSIIPLPNPIDEQRLYLPSFGIFAAVVAGGVFVLVRMHASRTSLVAAALTALIVILVFSAATYKRNALWQDNIALWEDIVRKSSDKLTPHINLGKFYDQAGRYDDAVREFARALDLSPGYRNARRNLIITYVHQGRIADAEREFRDSLGPGVDAASGYYYLGGLLAEEGMFDEAASALRNALRLNPRYREAREQLGRISAQLGRTDEAVRELEAAAALDPAAVPVRYDLGVLYAQLGRYGDAARALETVVKLDPGHAEAYNNLGGVYLELGRLGEALACLEAALRLRPDVPDIRYNLEMVRERMRREGMPR